MNIRNRELSTRQRVILFASIGVVVLIGFALEIRRSPDESWPIVVLQTLTGRSVPNALFTESK